MPWRAASNDYSQSNSIVSSDYHGKWVEKRIPMSIIEIPYLCRLRSKNHAKSERDYEIHESSNLQALPKLDLSFSALSYSPVWILYH